MTWNCLLPNCGELGWKLFYHSKFFETIEHKKIAVCSLNEDVFFPSADEIFIQNFEKPDIIKGSIQVNRHDKKRIILNLVKTYGENIRIIQPYIRLLVRRSVRLAHIDLNFKPIRVGAKVDIVIAPRNKSLCEERNFKYWNDLVHMFKKQGYSVGAIGLLSQSFDTDVDVKSWEHIPNHTDIEMLQGCKLCITVNSGCGVMSLLCNTPTYMIHPKGCDGNQLVLNALLKNHKNKHVYDEENWNNPLEIFRQSMKMIHD